MGTAELHPETITVAAGRPHRPGEPLNQPVSLAAPLRHDPGAGPDGTNGYARNGATESVAAFEHAIGALEGGATVAFASGMAAISAFADTLRPGAVVVAPRSAYWGTVALFEDLARRGLVRCRPVDLADTAAVLAALPGADVVWLETITNPMIAVPELDVITAAAHRAGALVGVDATFTPPILARTLQLGAQVAMHSATKIIGGHSDLLAGLLSTRDPQLAATLRARRAMTGAVPGGLDSYLALRGLRTLAVRLDRAQRNAGELAQRLSGHRAVRAVRYPGLAGDPGYAVAQRLYRGAGTVLSFDVAGGAAAAERICADVELITHATSLGGVESTIERRARHAGDASLGTPPQLLRLSVGIEHVDDLWADLSAALEKAAG